MGINEVIIYIMVLFMILGAIDKIIGNKFGLGEQFEEGIMSMGALALSMVGIICLAPVLADILIPIVSPISGVIGNDKSVFAGMILANDMGGYQLAQSLTESKDAAMFSGLILGSMFGPTLVFTLPVALGIIEKDDHKYLANGVLLGLIAIPFGCLAGGLIAGFSIPMILINLVPVIIISLLIMLGLKLFPNKMISGFTIFGKGIVAIATIGFALGIFQELTGITLIAKLAPVGDGIATIGGIAIVLAGAFPMVHFITKVFSKQLNKLGKILGMNDAGAAGLIATLANSIPMFGMLKDMNHKAKIINIAFAVPASFVLGDHLGFTAGVEDSMIFPMMVGKIVAGIIAIAIVLFVTSKEDANNG